MQLVVSHLKKKFGDKIVLNDISFRFEPGKIYGLLGRNGAGKTTFFHCLNRDIKTDGGEFYLEDGANRRAPTVRDVGFVQSLPLVPEFLTGREFVKFFAEVHEDILDRVPDMDARFDEMHIAAEDRDRLMKDYSHGTKNKMQMLVQLMLQPTLLLLDEPLTSLDVVVAEEMKQLLRGQKEARITILSTHLLDLALDICDEIVLLSRGVLERVDRENLNESTVKEKILTALREDEHG